MLEQIAESKAALVVKMIEDMRRRLDALEQLLAGGEPEDLEALLVSEQTPEGDLVSSLWQERSVDGVFDGEFMVGEDGRRYAVPPNYASKSKLVEGDLLRLTVTENGKFIYKQRGPIERTRLVGTLVRNDEGQDWHVAAEGAKFRVLPASVSFFKGSPGDDVVVLVPKSNPSNWAAVENIIKQEMAEY